MFTGSYECIRLTSGYFNAFIGHNNNTTFLLGSLLLQWRKITKRKHNIKRPKNVLDQKGLHSILGGCIRFLWGIRNGEKVAKI